MKKGHFLTSSPRKKKASANFAKCLSPPSNHNNIRNNSKSESKKNSLAAR